MRHPTLAELRGVREHHGRVAEFLPSDRPEPVSRTHLDRLHHEVTAAAIDLGVVCGQFAGEEARKRAVAKLDAAEQAYASALDRAVPVGGALMPYLRATEVPAGRPVDTLEDNEHER